MNQGLVLQVSYLILFIWVCFESYFKGSAVIKYTYLACLKVVLWFLFAICDLFVFMVHWAEKYSDSCQTSKMELSAKLVHKWELLTFYSKKLDLRLVLNTPHLNTKSKMLAQVLLHIAIRNNMYLLQFQYSYSCTQNVKHSLVSSPKYRIFMAMKIWKTLQRLAAVIKMFSWEINFPKMLRNLNKRVTINLGKNLGKYLLMKILVNTCFDKVADSQPAILTEIWFQLQIYFK